MQVPRLKYQKQIFSSVGYYAVFFFFLFYTEISVCSHGPWIFAGTPKTRPESRSPKKWILRRVTVTLRLISSGVLPGNSSFPVWLFFFFLILTAMPATNWQKRGFSRVSEPVKWCIRTAERIYLFFLCVQIWVVRTTMNFSYGFFFLEENSGVRVKRSKQSCKPWHFPRVLLFEFKKIHMYIKFYWNFCNKTGGTCGGKSLTARILPRDVEKVEKKSP